MKFLRDSRLVRSMIFFPRSASQRNSSLDGTIPVDDDIVLGYRVYPHQQESPLILYFHGNGETVDDYDDLAADYHYAGASLLVVDYRGYGWSTGEPLASSLLTDVVAVHEHLPSIIDRLELAPRSLYVMGRSLGSISAIEMVDSFPEEFDGLIIESGLAHVLLVYFPWGWLPLHRVADLFGNLRKIRRVDVPLLVIHGEEDRVLPVRNGQKLYDMCPTSRKTMLRLPQVGHNDLVSIRKMRSRTRYERKRTE